MQLLDSLNFNSLNKTIEKSCDHSYPHVKHEICVKLFLHVLYFNVSISYYFIFIYLLTNNFLVSWPDNLSWQVCLLFSYLFHLYFEILTMASRVIQVRYFCFSMHFNKYYFSTITFPSSPNYLEMVILYIQEIQVPSPFPRMIPKTTTRN